MRRNRTLRTALIAVAALLAIPAGAQATVTIGSDLGRAANTVTGGCAGGTCTFALGALDQPDQAPGGLASPVNGTITKWRVKTGVQATPAALRLVRPLGNGLYASGGASPTVMPPLNAVDSFSVQIPIQRGDLLGIDCCGAPGAVFFGPSVASTSRLDFEPGPLGDSATGTAPAGSDHFEVLINADVEPTSAFTVVKGKAKKGGAITMIAKLPNAGTLTAQGKGKPRLVKPSSTEAGPGPVSVTLATTKAARALVAERGRLRIRVMLTFTPAGGSTATQAVSVKLHR